MLTRLASRATAWDRRAFRAAHVRDAPVLDRILPPLTTSADHGLLWLAASGVLALSGQRRAAVRGLLSLATASAIANVPAKHATRRRRPLLDDVRGARQLLRQPTSSSFPSGHSASAAAFATGVAIENPIAAIPIVALAAGVSYGRVHTGVHYPGDVLVGLGIGMGAAVLVKRVWPRRPLRPAFGAPTAAAPSVPDGEGLVLVINSQGGSADSAEEVIELLAQQLPRAEVVRAEDDLEHTLKQAAARASVLGAMGGDGTINAAAKVAMATGLPLLVIPGGTLNHFAAEVGIATAADSVGALQTGSAIEVSVGTAAADVAFLNTFALGVYPDLVREREKLEAGLGKWPAMAVASARLLRSAQRVQLEVDGERRELWTLFAGNGQYHPAGFAPTWRERISDGAIDVRLIDAARPYARIRLLIALLTGQLGRSSVHEARVVSSLPVRSLQGPLRVGVDGEVVDGPQDFLLRAAAERLVVYAPKA